MSEITMVVSSIDPLAPYKASGDLVLELVSVTTIRHDDPPRPSKRAKSAHNDGNGGVGRRGSVS
jgi:hypothetical protein